MAVLALLQAASSDLSEGSQLPALESPECGNHVVGGSLDLDSEFERRLAVGAQLACQLRNAVKDKLGMCHHKLNLADMSFEEQPCVAIMFEESILCLRGYRAAFNSSATALSAV